MIKIITKFLVGLSSLAWVITLYAASDDYLYHTVLPKPQHALRVASYNISDDTDYPIKAPMETVKAIQKVNADIIFMQEAIPFWLNYFNRYLSTMYSYRVLKPYRTGGGLIIMSKYPIKTVRYVHSSIGWFPAWYVQAQTPIGNIQMLNVHLSPPLVGPNRVGFMLNGVFKTRPIRRAEMIYYYNLLNKKQPTIIAGDFNEGDFGGAVKFLRSQGFTDALYSRHILTNTWFLHLGPLTLADRYDHILYSPNLRAVNVQVLKEGDSDHYPIFVDVKR